MELTKINRSSGALAPKWILFVLFCLQYQLKAQEYPTVIPPAPSTAGLMDQVEVPLNHSTGRPNISIPLHAIAIDGIQLPIALSYDAGGIKVEAKPGWVGQNWSLSAGGMVSRKVVGLADDRASYGYMNTSTTVDVFEAASETQKNSYLHTAEVLRQLDLQPDVFTFNFAGYTGKFYYDQSTGEFQQQELSEIKIIADKTNGIIDGWEIVTPDGARYFFGTTDVSNTPVKEKKRRSDYQYISNQPPSSTTNPVDNITTGWPLRKIITPNKRVIDLTYQTNNLVYYGRNFESQMLDVQTNTKESHVMFAKNDIDEQSIHTISYPGGEVKFILSSTNRNDCIAGKYLENMEIYGNGVLLKKLEFNFDYYQSNNPLVGYMDNPTHEPLYKGDQRLRLKSVSFQDDVSIEVKKYELNYYHDTFPDMFCTAQDYWGFYNGANNGDHLVTVQGNEPDRTIDETACKQGLLKEMIYPTGGKTVFHYEANDAIAPHRVPTE